MSTILDPYTRFTLMAGASYGASCRSNKRCLLLMLWTGAPGDRQEVDGGSLSR